MGIRIIITGGTFDKYYDEIRGELTFKDSHLPGILRQARVTVPVALELSQLVDSLHMTPAHRLQILDACRRAPEQRILIIHGTDTMVETARVLGTAALDKTVVLTGAMIPYAVNGSDSLFNLGAGVSAVQLLPAGVYVAMNGRLFAWDNVRKDLARGVFEPLPGPETDNRG